jgi:hypothetical protein
MTLDGMAMEEVPAAGTQGTDDSIDSIRTGHWWQAFTGLLPVLLMVPILLAHAYTAGVVVATVAALGVVAYHLSRRQGITPLDVLALGFALTNLVLYVGFGNPFLIHHLDAVFYTLLAGQSAVSLLVGTPWTTQFTRRTVAPAFWDHPAFRDMNVVTTRLWAACFVACDVLALTLADPLRVWAPVGLMGLTVVLSRRLARQILTRRLGTVA